MWFNIKKLSTACDDFNSIRFILEAKEFKKMELQECGDKQEVLWINLRRVSDKFHFRSP